MTIQINILCKPIECRDWLSCGGREAIQGNKLIKETKKEKLYLCKNFKDIRKGFSKKEKGN